MLLLLMLCVVVCDVMVVCVVDVLVSDDCVVLFCWYLCVCV